jgi:putative oxidoreductase
MLLGYLYVTVTFGYFVTKVIKLRLTLQEIYYCMKKEKLFFWVSTGVFSLSMLFSATMYLTVEEVKAGFAEHLGIPAYLRVELAVAKILGALTLLLPFIPKGLKYFAYAGFTINLISASVAHIALGDPAQQVVMPVVFLVLLLVSFFCYMRLERGRQISGLKTAAI